MRRSLKWNSSNTFYHSDGDPRASSVLTSGGCPRRDNYRVRQRPSSSGVCTSTTTAAMMLCSLLGFNLQGLVLANEGHARLMDGTVGPSFFGKAAGSTTRSPRLCSSSSDTCATRNCVFRYFNKRLRGSYGGRRTTGSSAFVLITARLNRRPWYDGEPAHRILPRPLLGTNGDEDPLSPPRCVDSFSTNDCQQQATTTGRHFLQGTSHPPSEETSPTTRLGFLRHSSVCAVAIAGAASSAVLMLDPPSAADAASAAYSSASKTGPSSAMQPWKEMVWLDADAGTVSSRLSQADETYGKGFVAYLARFLLNYDEGCREYFNGRLDVLVPKRDGSHVWEEFRGFVASVGVGLHRFAGSRGAGILCESLSRKYATPDHVGAAEQLAVLFTLLPPEVQPVATVKSLLSTPVVRRAMWSDAEHPGTVGVDPSSVLGQGPTELLPAEFRPRYDEKTKVFYVPGIPRKLDGDSAELLFGSRGPFPTSKERGLSAVDFGLFALCGAIGCTSTHLTVVPLDVVKTRLQTNPGRYEGLTQGVVTIAREEGWPMLLQGIGPTLAGYLWYGITVYPGYELFKRLFIDMVGPLNAALFRVPLVLAAGATATTIACIGVCPAEAVRIRQVADPSVGDMLAATRQIVAESGWPKLYDGLPSILFRQISFGMMKFLVFDFFTEFVYGLLPFLAEKTSTQLSVSLTSGLVAGVCAAIVSQPADTVLSILNRDPGRATIPGTLRSIVEERGIGGLFLGLESRIVWSGAIISGQFLLYDICKTALHVSASDLRVFLDAVSSAGL